MNQEAIGEYIKQKRLERALSQEQLAEKLGVSKNTISRWERGINIPDLGLLDDLALALNTGVSEIIKGHDKINNTGNESLDLQKNTLLFSYSVLSKLSKMNELIKKIYISLEVVVVILLDLAYGYFATKIIWQTKGGLFYPHGVIFSAIYSNTFEQDASILFLNMFKVLFIVFCITVFMIMILVELRVRRNDLMTEIGNGSDD